MMSCNDNHHGTQMPLTSAVHTITVTQNVLADGLGVLMAAAPIYVARFRQIQQGDTRPESRRSADN